LCPDAAKEACTMTVRTAALVGAALIGFLGAPARADYIVSWTTPDPVVNSIEGHMSVRLLPRDPRVIEDGGNFVAANLVTEIDTLQVPPGTTEHFNSTAHLIMTVSDGVNSPFQDFSVDITGSLRRGLVVDSSHIMVSAVSPPNA